MITFELAATRAHADARAEPTPLLTYVAGEHAEAVTRAWPAPHVEFLTLPAARRHLAAIALMRVRADEFAAVRGLIERAPLRDALVFALRPTPRGLARALTLMGEALWTGAAYDALLALMFEPNANLVLRHAPAVTADLVARLEALPPVLRETRIVANTLTPAAAGTLGEAFAAARWINPRRPERDLVLAWARANGAGGLMRAAIDALKPDRFGAVGPAPELPKPYRRLAGRAAVEATALRFRNCMASYVWEAAAEELALYTRDGEPPVALALKRDVGGWRLAEALAAENYPLPDAALAVIVGEMRRAGVRVGHPIRSLEDRLDTLAEASVETAPRALTRAAQLGLGQLWR